jgi:hypothetical protein
LDFSGYHSGGVGRKKQTNDLQARFTAKRGEAVGTTGYQERVSLGHISIIAETWRNCNPSLFGNPSFLLLISCGWTMFISETRAFSLLTMFLPHGILLSPGIL